MARYVLAKRKVSRYEQAICRVDDAFDPMESDLHDRLEDGDYRLEEYNDEPLDITELTADQVEHYEGMGYRVHEQRDSLDSFPAVYEAGKRLVELPGVYVIIEQLDNGWYSHYLAMPHAPSAEVEIDISCYNGDASGLYARTREALLQQLRRYYPNATIK